MNLNDRYTVESGKVYLTGIQALVRLPMDQMRADRAAGLKTGTFISGYEGSPLGGYDLQLQRVGGLLRGLDIHFWPGVNEDMAATAIFGSQIYQVMGQSKYDGVLGIWYGKGPGVDRSGDILRHANLAGSPGHCGTLVLAGDDHGCKSSSIPHQSDFSLMNFGIPVLFPGNTQEILDLGLLGIALSRYTGAWCGMKLLTQVCDGGGTVEVSPGRLPIQRPAGYEKKTDPRLLIPFTSAMEPEVNRRRLDAAKEFARANKLNRWFGAGESAWLGIATAGKYYYDLMQALQDLGIAHGDLEAYGIRIAKFGMTFPVEPHFAREFAAGLKKILVLEEKRSFLEMQLRDALYNASEHPFILGKEDEAGAPFLPAANEMDPDLAARAVAGCLQGREISDSIRRRLAQFDAITRRPQELVPLRPPNFCSGCPHNRSTLLLDGQVAGGGIGCHGMSAMLSDANRGYLFCTHMGGEGVPFIGMSPFVERKHLFQNMGDGTYFHSGSIAIESCIAAGINVTFKILYNGHVAMTGGQQATGVLPIPELSRKLEAEGVKKIVVLAEDVTKYMDGVVMAKNAEVRDRNDIQAVLADLEKISGVTVIIYDQQCAAEKRRWRSRGKLKEPVKRLVVHEEVCEGCGDCVKQSNCMSLHPVETDLGQKIRIHQSSCNKDYSCALGDCPSFLTVNIAEGTGLKKRSLPQLPETDVPDPREIVKAGNGYRILMPGIGGTGVVTINALLATAAMIDGLYVSTLDQTGLAQKGGAVVSHLILSEKPIEAAARINTGNCDLILGFDLLGAANAENLKTANPERTAAVVNTSHVPTGEDIRKRQVLAGPERMVDVIKDHTRHGHNVYVDATRLAENLFGSHLSVNTFLMGVAFQAGLLPVTEAALKEAIRLNGVEVERNLQGLSWGRKYYVDAAGVEAYLKPAEEKPKLPFDRVGELRRYQNAAYARDYEEFVETVRRKAPALAEPVARYLYKLMAYKDEYEVARLLTKPEIEQQTLALWGQPESMSYNLHPPLLRALGVKKKLQLGPWFRTPLRIMASLKVIRGTPFDIFGYMPHRRRERSLIGWYRALIEEAMHHLTEDNAAVAMELAALPDQIRGYERIKDESIVRVKKLADDKLALLRQGALQQAPLGR
ncbi:MAG TPA: indolepyruvate ferredoxin oxidoreductase family protein [Bryobacteraceae bacterium]|nr:indolepyruvate ferredoxin oxidoreductase family protein [Bryobacteraceae bacterium]